MIVLGIESSCDETAAAVVDVGSPDSPRVLSNVVASQHELHAEFGGVVPEIASRRHLEVVDAVVVRALEESDCDVDAVAVTIRPGLIGALLVGVGYAKGLSLALEVPLIPVDHLVAHVASAQLTPGSPRPPFTCLLASGGHTLLLDVRPGFQVHTLGGTRDDAAGEAFDKAARLLGLGQPGGPAIEARAAAWDGEAGSWIGPAMAHHATPDMSFAGLKTALAVHLRSGMLPAPAQRAEWVASVAHDFQAAVVGTLVAATRRALDATRHGHLVVVGGVAANAQLRSALNQMCGERDVELHAAPLEYCGDNAAMVAVAAASCTPLQSAAAALLDAEPASAISSTGNVMPTSVG